MRYEILDMRIKKSYWSKAKKDDVLMSQILYLTSHISYLTSQISYLQE